MFSGGDECAVEVTDVQWRGLMFSGGDECSVEETDV